MAAPPTPGREPRSPSTHSHNAAGIWPARPPPLPPWRCAGPGSAGSRARLFLFLPHRVWRGRSCCTALAPSLPAPAASASFIRCRGRGESLPRLGRQLAPPANLVVSAGLSDRLSPAHILQPCWNFGLTTHRARCPQGPHPACLGVPLTGDLTLSHL